MLESIPIIEIKCIFIIVINFSRSIFELLIFYSSLNDEIYMVFFCFGVGNAVAYLVKARTILQAGRPRVRFPMKSLNFYFNLPNATGRTMALGLTQPLAEMSTRNLPGE
jgi:hypothetical protein